MPSCLEAALTSKAPSKGNAQGGVRGAGSRNFLFGKEHSRSEREFPATYPALLVRRRRITLFENPPTPCHLASARQHLDVETQAGHSSERAVEGPLG